MKNPHDPMAERIDDLQCRGYQIIQDTEGFCFGQDAVLLANYALRAVKPESRVLDLGTGTGIVPLLIAAKSAAGDITGLEIQDSVASLAERSVVLNGAEDRVHIVRGDLRKVRELGFTDSMNVVTSNPPYMNTGLRSTENRKLISRHEVLCSFSDVARAAALTLKSKGHFFLVHRPNRLAEIMAELRRQQLEPRRLRLVYPFAGKEANLFLLEAIKGGGTELHVEAPLIVYKAVGEYTDEIREIYYQEG